MIVMDASTIISAALIPDSIPWQALMQVRAIDVLALSEPVASEITEVLTRPKFAQRLPPATRTAFQDMLFRNAAWFAPATTVQDCRDPKDNKYLELTLVSAARFLVTSDNDLRILPPWRGIPILSPSDFLHGQ